MSNPASVIDLEARWRPLTAADTRVAQSLLDDAWQILTARITGLQTRLDGGLLAPELVTTVVCAMVLRVLRNPDGKRQETIDDYSWTRDNAVSGGLLYLSDDEAALLGVTGATSGAFTITPASTPYVAGAREQWVDSPGWYW